MMSRRKCSWLCGGLALMLCIGATVSAQKAQKSQKYLRFRKDGAVSYGVLEGTNVRALRGNLFGSFTKTRKTYPLGAVELLPPTVPTQVFALAGNYKSHIGDAKIPPKFRIPQPFYKSPSCLIGDGADIVIPKDSSGNVHFEAELVIVIGKKAKNVSKDKALDYVFGVTCGNDVSERYWQNDENDKDVQWWRAKGADTFGPVGPYIATGLNYDDLLMSLRLNGKTMQKERTSQLIHGVAASVSFISRYVTLHPGDLIFTGTPGKTEVIKPGDEVEVELEGVGVLRNKVVAEK